MSEALNIVNYLRVPKPLGIIHVGANSGQEIEAYKTQVGDWKRACLQTWDEKRHFDKLSDHSGEFIPREYLFDLC